MELSRGAVALLGGGSRRDQAQCWTQSRAGTLCSWSNIQFFLGSICWSVLSSLAVFYRWRHSSLHAIESHSGSDGRPILGGRCSGALPLSSTSGIRTFHCRREPSRQIFTEICAATGPFQRPPAIERRGAR